MKLRFLPINVKKESYLPICFYGQKVKLNSVVIHCISFVNKDAISVQYKLFKRQIEVRNQREAAKQLLKKEHNSKELLTLISSKEKVIKFEKIKSQILQGKEITLDIQ